MILVTDTAKKRLKDLMEEEGKSLKDSCIRVGVTSGGCSGLSYNLDFDSVQGEEDKVLEHNGVRVLIDKKSVIYLVGTTLDYSGGLNGKGFFFSNPNASRTCGCGESFAV